MKQRRTVREGRYRLPKYRKGDYVTYKGEVYRITGMYFDQGGTWYELNNRLGAVAERELGT